MLQLFRFEDPIREFPVQVVSSHEKFSNPGLIRFSLVYRGFFNLLLVHDEKVKQSNEKTLVQTSK